MPTPARQRRALNPVAAFGHLRVAQKLVVSFGIVCLLLVGVGVTGLVQLSAARERLETMYADSTQAIHWLGEVRGDLQEARALAAKLILRNEGETVADVRRQIATIDAHLDARWADYTATDMTGREADRDAFATTLRQYRYVRDERLVAAGETNDIAIYLRAQAGTIDPLAAKMTTSLANLSQIEDDVARTAMAEARDAAGRAQAIIIALVAGAVLISIALVLLVGRAIARPLGQTVTVLEGLADGRLDQRLAVGGRDEVGRMAQALNTALDRLTAALRGVGANVDTLGDSSTQLTRVAGRMEGSAGRSAEQARAVAAASAEISRDITTVSAGAEEIGSSIAEIARSTTDAAGVAGRAVTISGEAAAILRKLDESSAEIVSVVKIITSIAEQTNLLALNATIEAARAGDAGRGFAVVAGEVKELAQETARATEDISARVAAIRTDSAAAVAAIDGIGTVIDQINATQSAIAAAVEEQTATTNEMGRTVSSVAVSTSGIAANVAGVAEAADDTTAAAGDTAAAADELTRIARALRENLATFRY